MVEQINEDECRVTVDGVTGDAVVVKATLDDFQMGMSVETTGPGYIYVSGADMAMKAEMEKRGHDPSRH